MKGKAKMANYLLFLYDDPSQWAKLSPEEMQTALEKYMAWGRNAFVRSGERLAEDAGKVIRSENGQGRAADGPYSETKEILAASTSSKRPAMTKRSSGRSTIRTSCTAAPSKSAKSGNKWTRNTGQGR